MQYLKNLLGSFTNPQTYADFVHLPTRKAFWHFFISMLLIGLAQGAYFSTQFYPPFHEQLVKSVETTAASYPADLIINWDGSQLTTSPEKYHVLEMSAKALPIFSSLPADEKLVYINDDLTTESAIDAMDKYGAAGILDRYSMFYVSQETGREEQSLSEAFGDKAFTVTSEQVPTFREMALVALATLQRFVLWLAPVVWAVLLLLGQLVTSLVLATVLFFLAKLGTVIKTWAQSWQFTLVLIVVVQLISIAASLLYPGHTFPVFSVAFWALAAFILLSLNKKSAA